MSKDEVFWDPYDPELAKDPYPALRKLREKAPVYYNEQHNFYAILRYEDVEKAVTDRDLFISGKGGAIEFINAGIEYPPGIFIFEDPPMHTAHRGLVSRVFSPKRVAELEPKMRQFCREALDPLVESGEFDFIADIGGQMPMQVIGMVLGIPEEDRQAARKRADDALLNEEGKPSETEGLDFTGEGFFDDYIKFREKNPSDDLMTDLLTMEFVDEMGETRRLTREEILVMVTMLTTAGNETTNRLIGWTGKVLAEHPDQRREIYENRALIPRAIEEVLRFEPPVPYIGRTVSRDVELYGVTIPEGAAVAMPVGSANRDENKFVDPDRFDIHRPQVPHFSFSRGFHACLGNVLARMEGQVALDEILNRFPEWDVDLDNARLSSTSFVRGWETLPAYTPGSNKAAKARG